MFNSKKFINKENSISLIMSIIASFVFLLNSPLHPWIYGDANVDSSVFQTIIMMMKHGYSPYKDSFDHKGPFLYFINYIGMSISYKWGIFFIELLFMTATIYVLYKVSRLFCGVMTSFLVILVSFSLMFVYFEGGNYTEEYALPFISIAIYIFIDYLVNDKVNKFRLIICGLSLGAVLMLRPNMIAVWIVFCIEILIIKIKDKDLNELGIFIIWFVVGILIITIPIMIWLVKNDILMDCFNSYILFNNEYVAAMGGGSLFGSNWYTFWNFFNTKICLMAIIITVYLCVCYDRFINITYLACLIMTLIMVSLSGAPYGHYGMIIVPVLIYPLANGMSCLERIDNKQTSEVLVGVLGLYLIISIIIPNWLNVVRELPDIYSKRDEIHGTEIVREISSIINENTDEDDKISVYGNWDIIYLKSNRMHATRYSYQFPISEVMSSIKEEYFNEMQDELPKIVVIQKGKYDIDIQNYLKRNEYKKFWTEVEDDTGAIVFKR